MKMERNKRNGFRRQKGNSAGTILIWAAGVMAVSCLSGWAQAPVVIDSSTGGPQVDYPPEVDSGQFPSDEVVSARVELYYYRNAARVAQIINRNLKSYNGAAVTAADKAAQAAQTAFQTARSERRDAQADARQKAADLRRMRKQLADLVNQMRQTMAANKETLEKNGQQIAELETQQKELQEKKDGLTDSREELEQDTIPALNADLTKAKAAQSSAAAAEATAARAVSDMSDTIQKLQESIGVAEAELDTVDKQALQDAITELDRLKKLLANQTPGTNAYVQTEQAITTTQNNIRMISRNNAMKAATVRKNKLELSRRENDLKALAAKHQSAQAALTKATATVDALQQKVDGANRQVSSLKRQETGLAQDIARIVAQITALKGPLGTPIPQLKTTLESLVTSVTSQETKVAAADLKVRQKQDVEQQAAANQFRKEVNAAKADPNNYVPGRINSEDPVAQVSIAVIGEGVLYLRGPRSGVTRVRHMINQIDHPVGQVKIGIMTVQINGESGRAMEGTIRRLEGNLSRGRFLTFVSGQLFQRSVAETAIRVAGHVDGQILGNPGTPLAASLTGNATTRATAKPEQLDRWRLYIQEFFGDDFLRALLDVDPNSEVLNPFNKLLSLSSADTLTMAEALFITGLAKAEYREQILRRFDTYLQCVLPQKDAKWVEINRIEKGWNPIWWNDEFCKAGQVMAYARRMYRFEKIRSMFERSYGDMIGYTDPDTMQLVNDRLTPFQRQFVKLVQGITWEHVLRQMHTELTDELFEAQVHLEAGNNISAKVARRRMMLVPDLRRKMARRDYIAEQHVAMLEALRGTKAGMDKLVKQTVIAMEDDVYAQYYNPALERMQRAAQEWDVELSQIERATILTNNRAFGKVAPQATYEFNLPKRGIAVAEALKAAYALHQDLGPLLGDPNFATLGKLYTGRSVSGAVTNGSIKKLLPGLPSDTDQKSLLYADNAAPGGFASNLQQLVPDPEIYKIETGTGFEVRPVVQPDGQSVTFDFNYMYSTDLLEPVNADEKHLGRIKRHFVNTEVQLGNLEWREISRYEVALRASRKGRGVPLLEDVPLIGLAFKPLPQSGGSIQKNIIVGQAAVYPTIDELMGLRPAAAAEDIRLLTNEDLRDIKAYQLLKARSSLEFQQQKLQEFSEKVNKVEQLRQQRRDADAARGSTLPLPVPQRSTSHRPAAPVRRATVSGGSPSGSAIRQAGFRKPAGSPKSVATSRRVED